MEWLGVCYSFVMSEQRIVIDPNIQTGKPIIKGTRITVELVIELLAQGWSTEDIQTNYPGLDRKDIQACLAYASEILKNERVYPLAS